MNELSKHITVCVIFICHSPLIHVVCLMFIQQMVMNLVIIKKEKQEKTSSSEKNIMNPENIKPYTFFVSVFI